MPLINGELDHALRDAGASHDAALAASASVADLERKVTALAGEVRALKLALILALGLLWLLFIRALG
jgi:uncharacterized protein YceH (UPF0502 family)